MGRGSPRELVLQPVYTDQRHRRSRGMQPTASGQFHSIQIPCYFINRFSTNLAFFIRCGLILTYCFTILLCTGPHVLWGRWPLGSHCWPDGRRGLTGDPPISSWTRSGVL